MEGLIQPPRMRELQQEAAPSYEVAARRALLTSALAEPLRTGSDPAWLYQLSAAMARGAAPSSLRIRHYPAYADPAAMRAAPLGGGFAGLNPTLALPDEEIQTRSEIARLSQVLSYARQSWQPYSGVFGPAGAGAEPAQPGPARTAVGVAWDRLAARAETLPWAMQDLARQLNGEHAELQAELARQRVAGIAQRQQVLVRALRRALSRLGFADAASLNADPRGRVVGEAYRTRFILAQFESNAAREQLSGVFYRGEV